MLRDVLAVDPDDELLVTGVEGGGAVHVGVRAELLGDVHPQVKTRPAVGGHAERLRSDPQRHRRQAGRRRGSRDVAPQRHHQATELGPAVDQRHRLQVHRRRPDEPGDERVPGAVVQGPRRVRLLQDPVLEHRDPVPHRHRLDLVVGDVDRGRAQPGLQRGDVGPRLHPELRIQVGQRLVHEEHGRGTDDSPAHRHPLPLTAGEGLRLAVEVRLQVQQLGRLEDLRVPLGLVDALELQREAHVVGHRHVRVERVVLEHHRDVPVLRRLVRHVLARDPDLALVDVLETREHPQRGGLARPGRTHEDHELAVADVEVQGVHRGHRVTRIDSRRPHILHFSHERCPSLRWCPARRAPRRSETSRSP